MKTRLFLSLVMFMMAVVALGVAPQAVQAQEITCEGDLIVTTDGSDSPYSYWLTGDGPGLPTDSQAGVDGPLTFTLPGPGTWSNLSLQFNQGPSSHSFSTECAAVDDSAAAAVVPVPGCDVLMNIPTQAVVGQFNWNSELYWTPGQTVTPMTYVEAGNTYYVAGQDATETYYKVLIACNWVWARKDTVGLNYDKVWNGAPLPTTIVD